MTGTTTPRRTTRVLVAAMFLVIGAAACLPDTGPPPTEDPFQVALFDAVNRERAANGLPALIFSPKLSVLAGGHSCDMARLRSLDHSDLHATLADPSYASFSALGENIAVVSSRTTAQQIHGAWMKSASHRVNILSTDFNVVGMAQCTDGSGLMWATESFGRL